MQAAKDAIKNITNKHGQHDTTVHENVAPAVTQENITRHQEDRATTAVDKEVHQDHYHTSVQPVHHKEVLPEHHHHKHHAVEERQFEHNDESRTKERIAQEAAQFKDTTTRTDGQRTTTTNPTVAGEHVHHHVHETIQPVVQKETHEPHVVHHTIPVHEVHHNAAQHHTSSTLPAVGIEEFQKKGGVLDGRGERVDQFSGEPRNVGGAASSANTGSTSGSGLNTSSTSGNTHSGLDSSRSGLGSTGNTSSSHDTSSGLGGAGTGAGVAGAAGSRGDLDTTNSGSSSTSKPSLMDKLNPKKDADGDGKAGFMK